MKRVKVIRCDGVFDLYKLSNATKLMLFPILAKAIGLWKASMILYRPQK